MENHVYPLRLWPHRPLKFADNWPAKRSPDRDRGEIRLRKRRRSARGIVVLQSDATLDGNPVEAAFHRCRSLVAALPAMRQSLCGASCPRGIAPACRLIARSDSEEAETQACPSRLQTKVEPYVRAGRHHAATPCAPWRCRFMDLLSSFRLRKEGIPAPVEDGAHRRPQRPQPGGKLGAGAALPGAIVLAIRTPPPGPGKPLPATAVHLNQQEESKLIRQPRR